MSSQDDQFYNELKQQQTGKLITFNEWFKHKELFYHYDLNRTRQYNNMQFSITPKFCKPVVINKPIKSKL